jgi:hypothetical protein
VYSSAFDVGLVPPEVVTVRSTVFAIVPAGAMAVIEVDEVTL